MRVLLNQLRTRLILGSLVFLLGLTVAVILVVRDILSFSARNMASVAQQALIDQQRIALLEITKREAELSDHAIHHNPSDLAPLDQRLQNLQLAPGAFAFVIDAEGRLVAVSSEQVGILFDKESSAIMQHGRGFRFFRFIIPRYRKPCWQCKQTKAERIRSNWKRARHSSRSRL